MANTITSIKKDLFFYYRFHDPGFEGVQKFAKGKLVIVKVMNRFNNLHERSSVIAKLISAEKERLINKAYDPIEE